MYLEVEIDGAPPVRLREAEDFKSFKVVAAEGTDDEALARALEPVGELQPSGDAMIRIEAFKELAGDLRRDPQWLSQLQAMIAFAGSKGWLSEDGGSIQAHCERRVGA